MGKFKKSEDLIGEVINGMTVLKVIESAKVVGRLVEAECACGIRTTKTYNSFKNSKHICECARREEQKKKTGEKFNMLTIIGVDDNNVKNVMCKCDCGDVKSLEFYLILKNKYKSCGCLVRSKNTVGEQYNDYLIIEDIPAIKYGTSKYKRVRAKCKCGQERELCYKDLKKGRIKSCGCNINRLPLNEGELYGNWEVVSEGVPRIYRGKKTRTVDVKCVCGKTKNGLILSSVVTGKSQSCGCQGKIAKEKKEQEPIPQSTEDELWAKAFGFEDYYISSKGRIFSSLRVNRYMKVNNKTSLTIIVNNKSKSLNIAKVLYRTFVGEWDSNEYSLIFIDDDIFNCTLDNLFLARKSGRGENWVSRVLSNTISSSLGNNTKGVRKVRSLSKKDIIDQYKKQEGLSTFFKLPLDLSNSNKILAVSIDRIDNQLGYEKNNFTLVTRFENMGRGNTDFNVFLKFCENLKCKPFI